MKFLIWSFGAATPAEHVDVQDAARKRLIREAEYRQRVDSDSRVLRVSGKTAPVAKRIDDITIRGTK